MSEAAGPRWSTGGRGRPMIDAVARNSPISPAITTARNSTGRHCRVTARVSAAATTTSVTTTSVLPRELAALAMVV